MTQCPWQVRKQLGITWNLNSLLGQRVNTQTTWPQLRVVLDPDPLSPLSAQDHGNENLSWTSWWDFLLHSLILVFVIDGSNLMISACISTIMINVDIHFASSSFHCPRHLHRKLWVHLKMMNLTMPKTFNVAQKPLTTTISFLNSAHAELP